MDWLRNTDAPQPAETGTPRILLEKLRMTNVNRVYRCRFKIRHIFWRSPFIVLFEIRSEGLIYQRWIFQMTVQNIQKMSDMISVDQGVVSLDCERKHRAVA